MKAAKRCNLTLEARRRGGAVSAAKRRKEAIARLEGLTKREVFRLAFTRGWHQGMRTERRRWLGQERAAS